MAKADIVLVPFPFTEEPESTKVRPALCLTDPIGRHNLVILAFITSGPIREEFELSMPLPYLEKKTGLKIESHIILYRLATVTDKLILRKLGTLAQEKFSEIIMNINSIFVS